MYKYGSIISLSALCACGGGTSSDGSTLSPALISLSASQTAYQAANRLITLTAKGNDVVSAYCFKTSTAKPLASDTCFQSDASKTIDLTGSQAAYSVWGKSASNQVSDTALTGPCSSDAFAVSAKSSLATVCMMTDQGEMVIELESIKAPATVSNFLKYVNAGFYSGTVFHRLSPNFVQGGGGQIINQQLVSKTVLYDPIVLEKPSVTQISNKLHTIAMARTSVENSATAGFFINLDNNSSFDADGNAYAAFGRLIHGFSTAKAISKFPGVTSSDGTVTPTTPPVIQWAIQLK